MLQAGALALGIAVLTVSTADASGRETPIVGDQEGSDFSARCPRLSNLVGIELYSRDDIDAVRPVCASALGTTAIDEPAPAGEPFGGAAHGAKLTTLRCPPEAPIVTGALIAYERDHTTGINAVELECGVAGPNPVGAQRQGGSFAAPEYRGSASAFDGVAEAGEERAGCPKSFGTYVAVGLHGWSAGDWIHGLGFICDDPGFVAKRVGRTKEKAPVGLSLGAGSSPGGRFGATNFCETYAVDGVAAAIENRNLACGGEGGRWTTDYDRHFNWCMGLGGDRTVPDAEAAARAEALGACRAAKEQ